MDVGASDRRPILDGILRANGARVRQWSTKAVSKRPCRDGQVRVFVTPRPIGVKKREPEVKRAVRPSSRSATNVTPSRAVVVRDADLSPEREARLKTSFFGSRPRSRRLKADTILIHTTYTHTYVHASAQAFMRDTHTSFRPNLFFVGYVRIASIGIVYMK